MAAISMGVYGIRNLVNGRVYVGSTDNLHRREVRHKSGLKGGHHFNKELQRDYTKYGEEAFVFEVIEVVDDMDLIRNREMFWINEYKTINPEFGYNRMPPIPGETPNRDFKERNDGERSKLAILNAKEVIDICERLNSGESVKSIQRRYGLAQETVYRILRGRRWRDLGEVYFSDKILSRWKIKPDKKGIHPDLIPFEVLERICEGINRRVPDKELAESYGLSESGISVIRKGGCRSAETVSLLSDDALSLWTYNIHLVKHLMPKTTVKKPIVDKLKATQVLTNTQVKEICESLNRGLYPMKIASEYGVSPDTIHGIRKGKNYGVISDKYLSEEVKMGRGVKLKKENDLSDSAVIEICKMINNRLPIKEIAAEMGVHKATIYRVRSGDSNRAIGEKYLSDAVLSKWK